MPFLAPLLGFFGGPLGKLAGYAMAAVALVAVAAIVLHRHDNAVRAAMQAQADRAIAAAQAENAKRNAAALAAVAADSQARAVRLTTIRDATHAAPSSTKCVDSPAVRALLDGLRSGANRPGAAH